MSNKRNTRRSRRVVPKIQINPNKNILKDWSRGINSPFKGVSLIDAVKYTNRNYIKYKKANPFGKYQMITTNAGVRMNANEFYHLQRKKKNAEAYIRRRMKEIEEGGTYVAGTKQSEQSLSNNETYKALKLSLKSLQTTDLSNLSQYELDRKIATINANTAAGVRKKDQIFKDNMIEGLREKAKYSQNGEKLKEIADRISYLSTNEFRRLYNSDKAFRNLWDEYYLNKDMEVDESTNNWLAKIDQIYQKFDEMEENVRI